MEVELREIRFGMVAVQKGFVSPDQVIDALTIQISEELDEEEHRLLGEILLELEHMNASQIGEVLDEMNKQTDLSPELILGD